MKKILITILILIQAIIGFDALANVELESYSALRNDADLSAYYRFEGNSNDETANNNDGTDTNMSYGTDYGKYNQGARFGGTGKFSVNDSASLALTSAFTFMGWIKADNVTTNDYGRIIGQWSTTGNQYCYLFYQQINSGKLLYGDTSGGTLATIKTTLTSANVLEAGTWVHVAVVKNGTATTFYKNGSAVSDDNTATNAAAYNGTLAHTFGANVDGGGSNQYLVGNMDDFTIFDRVLTATEISDFYNATASASRKRLIITN